MQKFSDPSARKSSEKGMQASFKSTVYCLGSFNFINHGEAVLAVGYNSTVDRLLFAAFF